MDADLREAIERVRQALSLAAGVAQDRVEELAAEAENYLARAEAAEARAERYEKALREGGCQFYIDGDIGACQQGEEENPCAACAALEPDISEIEGPCDTHPIRDWGEDA